MRKALLITLVVLTGVVLLLIGMTHKNSQQNPNQPATLSVSGSVMDTNGVSLKGITLVFHARSVQTSLIPFLGPVSESDTVSMVQTDGQGRFSFSSVGDTLRIRSVQRNWRPLNFTCRLDAFRHNGQTFTNQANWSKKELVSPHTNVVITVTE